MRNIYFLLTAFALSFTLQAQIIDIPDANFKEALIDIGVDTNNDGEIQVSEAEAWTQIINVSNRNISSIEGIEYFINIGQFFCNNNELTDINVSTLVNLYDFRCANNMITSLNLENNSLLVRLYCQNNLITNLNLNNSTLLEQLLCNDNLISTLDLTNHPNLLTVDVYNNQITNLEFGYVPYNLNAPSVFYMNAYNNLLTTLDLSSVEQIQHTIDLSNNNLNTLILKNGVANYYSFPEVFGDVYLNNNPNLSFVCVDEFEKSYIQGQAAASGSTNFVVNSYCSFVPGGEYYTVEGSVKFDFNNDGCNVTDLIIALQNFSISNGWQTGSFIANSSGNYTIPVQEGSHTITPELENTTYFTVSPPSLTVDFPTDPSPYSQDFCLTANGSYNDLEVSILPLEAARPGFDTDYRLVYKNNGTTTLSGSVELTFQDDIMDFISAFPTENSQATNLLTWNFADLTPFEVREIDFTMNINSPMETPPVNGGDILTFIASVNHPETDETPNDNLFTLTQTVVNSFDPNDKTCLQGDVITPALVGEYVHYMIRFENTGTANAINIVVKDVIDTSKFDLSTLVPLRASHDFFARIENNYIEFIFEDINLPFDDANNDGFVIFKIRTLDTLQVGDTFENNAGIYFDFNYPIITNTTQTSIQTLGIAEQSLDVNVMVYPNPSSEVVTIETAFPMEAITLYDATGRIVKEIKLLGTATTFQLPTKNLAKGNYFVKVTANNKTAVKKLMVL